MCRNTAEGGRRCDCDNPTGRRQRRSLVRLEKVVSQYPLDIITGNQEHASTKYSGDLTSVPEIQLAIERLNSDQKLTPEETEQLACEIGSGIARFAETKLGAPTDETFAALQGRYQVIQEVAHLVERNMTNVSRLASQINQDFSLQLSMNYKALRGKILDKIPDEDRRNELRQAIEKTRLSVNRFLRSDEINYAQEFQTLIRNRAEGYRQALREVGVDFAERDDIQFAPGSNEQVMNAARDIMDHMPASWWRQAPTAETPGSELRAILHPNPSFRPHYIHKDSRVNHEYSDTPQPASEGWRMVMKSERTWTGGEWRESPQRRWKRTHISENPQSTIEVGEHGLNDPKIMIHELTHRAERLVPALYQAQTGFKQRRARGQALEPIDGNEDEQGYRDNFVHHYMGREYDHANHEILSTGMESVFYGAHSGLTHEYGKTTQPDPDYRSFILGIMTLRGK